jgi:hypothetical protein
MPTDLIHRIGIAAPAEAVLKPPHSKRWRGYRTLTNFAKRLDCGAFTAAVARLFPPGATDNG